VIVGRDHPLATSAIFSMSSTSSLLAPMPGRWLVEHLGVLLSIVSTSFSAKMNTSFPKELADVRRALVVVAHPDDETLFFGGLLTTALRGKADVLCVTDGNWLGAGAERKTHLQRACELLGVTNLETWSYRDSLTDHLPVDELTERFTALGQTGTYDAFFTHCPHGEYGHPNHMDVSFSLHAALKTIAPVYCHADRLYPDFSIKMDKDAYQLRMRILWEIYFEELKDSWRQLPFLVSEGYLALGWQDVEGIYRLCSNKVIPSLVSGSAYHALLPFLIAQWASPDGLRRGRRSPRRQTP